MKRHQLIVMVTALLWVSGLVWSSPVSQAVEIPKGGQEPSSSHPKLERKAPAKSSVLPQKESHDFEGRMERPMSVPMDEQSSRELSTQPLSMPDAFDMKGARESDERSAISF